MENKRLPQLCDDKTCTGCLACVNACGNHALTIAKNQEGFYRPKLHEDLCVMCCLCERVCPVITPAKKYDETTLKVFAAWHKDPVIRRESTSGGAFSALASVVLKRGGVIFGAAYSGDLSIEHIEVSTEAELSKLRLSKYAQSSVNLTFGQVKRHLQDGRMVMYVGTPCQIAGLKRYLHNEYENLLLVDFICHGVASIDMLQAYVRWLEKKYGGVTHINFRDKRKGWYDALRVIKIVDGRDIVIRGKDDNYWVAFNKNNNLQESCYHCSAQGFPRCSDITLADFWRIGHTIPFGHKEEIEKGVSMVVINNPCKLSLFQEVSKDLYTVERSIEEAIAGNRTSVQSCLRPKSRDSIYEDMRRMDYDVFRKKYMSTSITQDVIKLFREYLPYSIIQFFRLRKQK